MQLCKDDIKMYECRRVNCVELAPFSCSHCAVTGPHRSSCLRNRATCACVARSGSRDSEKCSLFLFYTIFFHFHAFLCVFYLPRRCVASLVSDKPVHNRTRRFSTANTEARHWTQSWGSCIHCPSSQSQTGGFWKQGAEESSWTKEGWSDRRMKTIT
jgi:hypothetical protein